MARIVGFPPLAAAHARVLILGSMPSRESLARNQYYAHPRNAFWPILTLLLDLRSPEYAERALEVTARGIAVWDVLKACIRATSLDADIEDGSIVTNDFNHFFDRHPQIRRVCFNGAKAESVYRKEVLPKLASVYGSIPLHRLPSTSPAHASMTLAQKTEAWRVILEGGLE